MAVIEHWTIRRCPDCGAIKGTDLIHRSMCAHGPRRLVNRDLVEIEVVPATQLRGAVDHLRTLARWGWGENAPDDAIRDWKEARAFLDRLGGQ